LTFYYSSTFNKLIENEYRRFKDLNPHADDALLRTKAINAVKRTSAQTIFERQEWYEKLTDPALHLVRETKRKQEVHKESRELLLETSKAYSASIKDPKNRDAFKESLRKLNIFANNNPNIVKPGTLAQIAKFTDKGIRDVVAQDFDPTGDYKDFIQQLDTSRNFEDLGTEGDPSTYAPLNVDDFSPTHKQMFMDEQIALIQADFPDASEAVIRQKLSDKIQKSPLGILYITGGHKAALKATYERFTVENRNKEIEYRGKLHGKFIDEGGTSAGNIQRGAARHTYNEVFKRLNSNRKLEPKEIVKLENQIQSVYKTWNSYFVKDGLDEQQKLSVNIAIHEILRGIEIDKDADNIWTLYLDESDVTVAGIEPFDDATNIKKNQALSAILGHIDSGERRKLTKILHNKIVALVPKLSDKQKLRQNYNDLAIKHGKTLRMDEKGNIVSLVDDFMNIKN